MQITETEVTETELKTAYNRTGLNRIGYSFEKAMQCELTKKCLVRMALNAQKNVTAASSKQAAPRVKPAREYWFNNI